MLFWVNGFRDTGLRERLGGESDVLVSLLGCVYGRIFGGVGRSFVIAPDLKSVTVPRLGSGMIYGVGM